MGKKIFLYRKHIPWILKITILLICLLVTILLFYALQKKAIFPSHQDEGIYYKSAELFFNTNSLKSTFCIDENRSKIGEFNWYGPGYHIIYGGVAKLIGGFNHYYFIIFHYILFLLNIYLLTFLPFNSIKKKLFIFCFLCSYASFPFIFSYFPEILHITINIILLVLFSRLSNKTLPLFITVLLIFSFIRVTSIFWIFSLLLTPAIQLSILKRITIILVSFFSIILFIYFITAPAFVSGLKEINGTHNSSILLSIKSIIVNGYNNTMDVYIKRKPLSIIYIFVIAVLALINIKKKEIVSLFFIIICTFIIFGSIQKSVSFSFFLLLIIIPPTVS